jgi:hypothetical protein
VPAVRIQPVRWGEQVAGLFPQRYPSIKPSAGRRPERRTRRKFYSAAISSDGPSRVASMVVR